MLRCTHHQDHRRDGQPFTLRPLCPNGLFALSFARLSESGPDLDFTEPFTWRPGLTTVRVEFWWDEGVDRYWVAT
jgi:hypothetical protein